MWDAKQLKEKRAADKISASQLAELLGRGASKENVYKWENGVVRPSSEGMSKKIQNYINGVKPKQKSVTEKSVKTNGVLREDYKEKYFVALEELVSLHREIALLRKQLNLN